MKTLFYKWAYNTQLEEVKITGETEHSYVCKISENLDSEFCVRKKSEGEDWFRTKEDYEAVKQKEKAARIAALKKELEELAV